MRSKVNKTNTCFSFNSSSVSLDAPLFGDSRCKKIYNTVSKII